MSRIWGGNTNHAVDSPTNYAGQAGVVVPEPAMIGLIAIGGFAETVFLRRRKA